MPASNTDTNINPAHDKRPRQRLNPVVGKARTMVAGMLGITTSGKARPAENPPLVLVACSGGPDSLALAAVLAFFAGRGEIRTGAVVVDHQMQPGSDAVAARAAATLRRLGLDPVQVRTVEVENDGVGPEAAARTARYGALEAAAAELGASTVLLGHTLDDQAESVLLGLARGSGTRSLAGIRERRGIYARPFLGLRRAETLEICADLDLEPWHDPTNTDPTYLRSRVRGQVLPFLEDQLGPGIAVSLHRSASILAQDADFLDQLAETEFARLAEVIPATAQAGTPGAEVRLDEAALRQLAPALRQRVLALAVVVLGGNQPSFERLLAAQALLERRGSAGPVEMSGYVSAWRQSRTAARGLPGNSPGGLADQPRVPQEASGYGKLVFRRNA